MQSLLVLYLTHYLLQPGHIEQVWGFAPFERLLHELGVNELTPVPKLSVTRGSLPENVQAVALDSRAR